MVDHTAREMENRFIALERTLRLLWSVLMAHSQHVTGEPEDDDDVGGLNDDKIIRQQQLHVERCGMWEKERWTVAARMFRDVRLLQVCNHITPINPSS